MNQFCTKCGQSLDDDDRFCGKCGAPRREQSRQVAPPTPAQSGSSAAAKPRGAIFGVVMLVALGGLLPALMFSDGCESTKGHIAVGGGTHGEFTFTPTGCASMQPYGRFGANLHGDGPNDGGLYVTSDPTRGQSGEIEVPGSCRNADGTECTVFPVPRDRCRDFAINVDFNGVVVNDVREVEGFVRLDCTLEDGTTVRGHIEFGGC